MGRIRKQREGIRFRSITFDGASETLWFVKTYASLSSPSDHDSYLSVSARNALVFALAAAIASFPSGRRSGGCSKDASLYTFSIPFLASPGGTNPPLTQRFLNAAVGSSGLSYAGCTGAHWLSPLTAFVANGPGSTMVT